MSPASWAIFHGVVRVVPSAFVRAPHLSPTCSPRTVPSAATLKSSASPLNSPKVLALPCGALSASPPSAAFPAATSFFPSYPSANRFKTPSTKSPANKLFRPRAPRDKPDALAIYYLLLELVGALRKRRHAQHHAVESLWRYRPRVRTLPMDVLRPSHSVASATKPDHTRPNRQYDRYFFRGMSVLILGAVFLGFAKTYFWRASSEHRCRTG
jgi:hypothetical protein